MAFQHDHRSFEFSTQLLLAAPSQFCWSFKTFTYPNSSLAVLQTGPPKFEIPMGGETGLIKRQEWPISPLCSVGATLKSKPEFPLLRACLSLVNWGYCIVIYSPYSPNKIKTFTVARHQGSQRKREPPSKRSSSWEAQTADQLQLPKRNVGWLWMVQVDVSWYNVGPP